MTSRTLRGEDARRLVESLDEICTPEEAERRTIWASRVLRQATGRPTQVPDGVPSLVAVHSPEMRLPRRYWTEVVHFAAYDRQHFGDHCGFEVYDEDGCLAFQRDHDGKTIELSAFLAGAAAGRGEPIAVRSVSVSDVTGVGAYDDPPDEEPVVREEWYEVDPYNDCTARPLTG